MEPIFVLDCEFRGNGKIKDIGVAFVMLQENDRFIAAKPERHALIRLGEPPKLNLFQACEIIRNMGGEEKIWASWGTNDRHELKRQTDDADLSMPVGYFHLDMAPMYAAFMGLDRPVRLKEAVSTLCGRFYGAQHHADDDAWNTARLLATMMNRFDRS